MHFTSADLREMGYDPATGLRLEDRGDTPVPKRKEGRARLPRHEPGKMNRTERAYADYLERLRLAGMILRWAFEPMKLRLADRTFYEPDFLVQHTDDALELHEVKGRWEDDARVKIKVAARLHPWFEFRAVKKRPQRDGGGWEVETFNG